jgi:hypothetical protein
MDRMYWWMLDRPAFLYHVESQEVVGHFLGRSVTLTQQGVQQTISRRQHWIG